jgi:hypothetical protein
VRARRDHATAELASHAIHTGGLGGGDAVLASGAGIAVGFVVVRASRARNEVLARTAVLARSQSRDIVIPLTGRAGIACRGLALVLLAGDLELANGAGSAR